MFASDEEAFIPGKQYERLYAELQTISLLKGGKSIGDVITLKQPLNFSDCAVVTNHFAEPLRVVAEFSLQPFSTSQHVPLKLPLRFVQLRPTRASLGRWAMNPVPTDFRSVPYGCTVCCTSPMIRTAEKSIDSLSATELRPALRPAGAVRSVLVLGLRPVLRGGFGPFWGPRLALSVTDLNAVYARI